MREDLKVAWRSATINASNFHVLHYRDVDGMLASAKNSGTHWLKFMLSNAIAHHFSVEPPTYSSGPSWDDIIGNPRVPPRYSELPRLTGTHTIPSRFISHQWVRSLLPYPPVVVLVRDIRNAMISNYVKWHGEGRYRDVSFSEYVRGDIAGKRFVADVWWYTFFHNRWGDVLATFPSQTMLVRYEDIQTDPANAIKSVARHFGIDLRPDSIAAGLKSGERSALRAQLDPDHNEKIVTDETVKNNTTFSDEDEIVLRSILGRHLRYDYGYDYF